MTATRKLLVAQLDELARAVRFVRTVLAPDGPKPSPRRSEARPALVHRDSATPAIVADGEFEEEGSER